MESSQLRRISIIGISILCLSPVEFFSNQLFETKEETSTLVMSTIDMKLEPNYLSNNYEIFNPNIKATSEEIEQLVSENKKKEITESEDNLESETTDEQKTAEKSAEKTEEKVVKEVVKETSSSTTNKTSEVSKTTETTTVSKKVEQVTTQPKVEEKQVTSTETTKVEENKAVSSNTSVANDLVSYAKQFVGNPYQYGGTDLYNGIDCSGFTMKIYEHFGYSLPHSSGGQSSYGTYVSLDSLAPGDLIFYGYNGSISHVAIYIGNGEIVHATTNSGGIKIASYTMMPIITARRILN